MTNKIINAKVFRFNPDKDAEPRYETFQVPFEEGLSAMDVLDYIYQNLDSSLAYYDHAGCSLGICGKCTARINGKVGLLCQTPVSDGELLLEPMNKNKVLKDLVPAKAKKAADDEPEAEEGGEQVAQDINSVDLIVRREIEALIASPLIEAYSQEFGKEASEAVAQKVIQKLALEAGKMLKMFAGGDTMEHLQRALPLFSQGGALEFDIVEASEKKAAVNVTRCKYAEMYKEHGLEKFGYLLGCGRDFALMEGFNPKIKFTRTQTIMEGADYCDFRFETED
ncbi:L-2-amino-thiazoline-4-carboxylic acid hydrolase [Desulfatibacillum aliphaticivorans]|uniref:L-2-amino-thiazoline-4-carboxylic acid hydrolase n=1 Tax=Desulfatibacillum aliphaticivorans TaxID=218208 RepID=UPI0003FD435E|nr:L-2-amino-thiazoline-4-carboxylic acid hydrolase [Desulfatibacillum aliphaticivorans]